MKPFSFRLDTVLKVRRHELTAKRGDLSKAQSEALRVQDLLAEVSTRAQQGTSLMNVRAQLGIPAGVYAAGARGAAALHQAIEILRAQSLTAQMEVDRARKCVLEAHTRVRALEKLRERAQKEHRREVGRVEQAEFDEIAARKSGWPE